MSVGSDPRFRAWSLLVDVQALLMPIFSEQMASHGMSMSYFDVLVNLLIADGQQARMSAIAERAVISFSRVSRVVDELESKGFVERIPDPDDGRVVVVRLTAAGRDWVQEVSRGHARDVMEHFAAHLTEDQALAIIEILGPVMSAHGRTPSPTEAFSA